jgi:hypothetical protein
MPDTLGPEGWYTPAQVAEVARTAQCDQETVVRVLVALWMVKLLDRIYPERNAP